MHIYTYTYTYTCVWSTHQPVSPSLFAFSTPKMYHAHTEAATCRLRTKKEARTKNNLTPQLVVNNTCVWFNGEEIFSCNLLWFTRNLYIEYFDTTDADLIFILGSNRYTNPTYINHIDRSPTGLASQVVSKPE